MAKGYRPVRRDQLFLLPPNMREWLPAEHPVWLLAEVVEVHLDTSAFHARRRTGGAGTAGYDPDMLLTLLIWAYAQGLTSSRRIEAACWTDVAFRVICAGDVPDHATIARFRADFAGPVQELFAQVLMLCARLGMAGLGTITLDGTKIAANASKAANRTEDGLRKLAARTLAAHAAADAAGDDSDPGQVPPDLARPGSRAARIQVALAGLEAERAAAQRDTAVRTSAHVRRADSGLGGKPPAGTEVAAAEAALARETARQQARIDAREQLRAQTRATTGKDLLGGPLTAPEQYHLVRAAATRLARAQAKAAQRQARAAAAAAARKGPGPVRNITDPDSRLMPVRGGGFIQGFNAQNVISGDKLIIATELTQDPGDTRWFEPMIRRAESAAQLITSCRAQRPDRAAAAPAGSLIGLILADAGYLSGHNLTIDGPDRLIATGKHRHLAKTRSRNPAHSEAIAAMAARLATADGITAYRQRGHIAETPHAQIKHNLGIRRLSLRGKPKAAAEWTFTCTVHNLAKAITTGYLTTTALSALASQPS